LLKHEDQDDLEGGIMKLGFIGLGIMGRPMAKNLLRAGYELVVYDIIASNVQELVANGAVAADSPKEVAKQVSLVLTMLPNSPHVRAVVSGPDGLSSSLRPGSVVVDMSSIAPLVSIELSQELAAIGVELVDAPVSGGEPKAVDGTLAIMAGGTKEVFDQVRDILSVMGASVTYTGAIGSGNITKLANQIMVAANIAGMSEALVLAGKAGVDPEVVYNAVRSGLAGSTVLDAKAPKVLQGDFKPGFRIELHIKDLQNVLDTASELGTPVPLTQEIISMMRSLSDCGHATDDHGGLIQFYEQLAGVSSRRR
jgi:2-hydroxy-3-oxopropionate reductase